MGKAHFLTAWFPGHEMEYRSFLLQILKSGDFQVLCLFGKSFNNIFITTQFTWEPKFAWVTEELKFP